MTLPLWPRPTTTVTCFSDGLEQLVHVSGADDVIGFLEFVTEYRGVDKVAETDIFFYFSADTVFYSSGSARVVLERYEAKTESYLPIVEVVFSLGPPEHRYVQLRAFIPRGTTYRFDYELENVDFTTPSAIAHITGSKT